MFFHHVHVEKERLEALQLRKTGSELRKTGSVLHMIQTLEITPQRRSKKPRLSFSRTADIAPCNLFILPDDIVIGSHGVKDENNDDDTFFTSISSSASSGPAALSCSIESPTQSDPPRMPTKRRRRVNVSSCDNDLSRQIEAMVADAETAHANRHSKKPKTFNKVVAHHSSNSCTKDLIVKEMNAEPLKTNKVSPRKSNTNPLELFQQMFITPKKGSYSIPAMKPCDSLASLSSDYSMISSDMSGGSVMFGLSPIKKTRIVPEQRNAVWSIIE